MNKKNKSALRWGAAVAFVIFSGYLFILGLIVIILKTYQQKGVCGYLLETPWMAPAMSLGFAVVAIAIWPKKNFRIVRK